jgi:hypothetical protein
MKRCIDPDRDHPVPQGAIGLFKIREHHEAGVVDQGVEPSEARYGEFDYPATCLGIFYVAAERGSDTAGPSDFCCDSLRNRRIKAAAVRGYTRVVDYDSTTPRGD